ncbi:hypothetical protein G7Y89_g7344 [Cudoniella acicularis]|uniref:Uncharacterized protein n=1 Tax=Cudoniella acicularis TaxID=354080 RepID=A0A8H4RJI6_9HELO|nr:hypothetical protein G7Y89_g7344 [Cudoniella acicularis]
MATLTNMEFEDDLISFGDGKTWRSTPGSPASPASDSSSPSPSDSTISSSSATPTSTSTSPPPVLYMPHHTAMTSRYRGTKNPFSILKEYSQSKANSRYSKLDQPSQ